MGKIKEMELGEEVKNDISFETCEIYRCKYHNKNCLLIVGNSESIMIEPDDLRITHANTSFFKDEVTKAEKVTSRVTIEVEDE